MGELMSETMNGGGQEVRFPEPPLTAEAHEAYYAEALENVRSGQPTWVQRDFETYSGRVLDLYADKKPVGSIEEEFGQQGFDVYLHLEGEDVPRDAKRLIGKGLSFTEAVELLKAQAPKKSSGLKSIFRGMRGH
jgi:hypothetical protein